MDLNILRGNVGVNVEHIGRKLKRHKEWPLEDLTMFRDALKANAETIDTIIKITAQRALSE